MQIKNACFRRHRIADGVVPTGGQLRFGRVSRRGPRTILRDMGSRVFAQRLK